MPYENIEEPSYLLIEEARKLYADVMPPHPIDIDKAQRLMEGAIDTHIHGGPDAWAKRYWNDIEIAMQAADMGMGAIVIKCHSSPSLDIISVIMLAFQHYKQESKRNYVGA